MSVTVPADPEGRYERLRGVALGLAVAPADRLGLTLLLRRGLWAWARAVTPAPVEPPRPAGPLVPPDRRAHLARLLAGMALAHTPATSAPP